jgi:ring-1,2-phenylacetyl-CoA epoxidase subunit PaaE
LNLSIFSNVIECQKGREGREGRMSVGFHILHIAEIIAETADAKSIRFDVPASLREEFRFRPGQHLTLKADIAGEELRRNYSLSVAPQEDMLKVTVKRIAGGVFSNWANDNLKAGDAIEVMPPHGSFTWAFDAQAQRHYAAFAGGSGITPVISLLKTALLTEPESRFALFYGNRDSSSVIFLEELARLKNRFMGRLEIYHFLAEEAEDVDLFNGILDRAKCDEILRTLVDPVDIDAFFICGPGPMMDAAEAALAERGVGHDHILIERFTADRPSAAIEAQMQALQSQAEGLDMLITLDGRKRRVAFDAAAGNILDSARAAGMSAPYACKAGVCATCRARVVSGEVEMAARYGLSDEEVAAGYVLTCQSVPKSAGVELDYDA